jgi:hypothetical protein
MKNAGYGIEEGKGASFVGKLIFSTYYGYQFSPVVTTVAGAEVKADTPGSIINSVFFYSVEIMFFRKLKEGRGIG